MSARSRDALAVIRVATHADAPTHARAQRVADSIAARTGSTVELVTIATSNEADSAALPWVSAVRRALLGGECDVVIHALDELPTAPHPGLTVTAIPRRGDAHDALVTVSGATIDEMPAGARLAVRSPLRVAQAQRRRPDLEIIEARAAIDDALGQVIGGSGIDPQADGVVLPAVGLERFERDDLALHPLGLAGWPPVPGQGALAIETLASVSGGLRTALQGIDHAASRTSVQAERAVLRMLGADRSVALGASAFIDGGMLFLAARLYSLDGSELVSGAHALYVDDSRDPAEDAARRVVDELLAQGAAELVAQTLARS